MIKARLLLAAALASCFVVREGGATLLDANFTETIFAQGAQGLTGLAWAPDGSNRLFQTRKGGQIRVIENGVLLPTQFARISPITTSSECGLLSIAFDPDFVNNHYVYVFATVSPSQQQIIRFTANGNVGESPTVIMSGLPTLGANHDGGGIAFGPDGKLYWSIGDNGSALGVDGDLTLLAAKVGRANRDGSVPNDNPFFDGAGPNNDYIWARGFRNPYTLTFQPATDRLWVNVVGTQYEQIFTPQAGDHAGWNDYESNQPAGFIPPVISYRTNRVVVQTIGASGAVRAAGVATFTTAVEHRFRPGAKITVAGVTDSSFNGTAYVSEVSSPTTFSLVQAGPNAVSGGGTATTQLIGGAVTGGTFWDSSAAPASHRGNFFFGDYNSGRLMRATLNASNEVTSVDEWGSGIAHMIDMTVGPDGDLYYAPITGRIYRASYNFTSQALVVSKLNLRLVEGGVGVFNVRLAMPPPGSINVNVTRSSGDSDVTVMAPSQLTFDASNWSIPQVVRLSAAQDADSQDDSAQIRVASAGLGNQPVAVRVTDDESFALVVSETALSFAEGGMASFDVSLSEAPSGPLVVTVARSAGDSDVQVGDGQLTFNGSNWATPQTVTVTAAEDPDTTDDAATITVSGAGLSSRLLSAAVNDNDDSAPSIVSTPVLSAVVGVEYGYDVDAEGLPAPSFSLDQAPSGMSIEPASGLIVWTPAMLGVESVTVRASNGISPDATQNFDIVVVEDQAPTCSLTSPSSGAVLSGTMEEFFGDVFDDVGAVQAEFSVDSVVVYTDVGPSGHYHFGGTHNLFDTTAFSDGPHLLTMTGRDTAGMECVAEVNVVVENGGGAGGAGGEAGAGADSGGVSGGGGLPGAGGEAGEENMSGGSGGTAGAGAGSGGAPEADAGLAGAAGSSLKGGGGGGCDCRLATPVPARGGSLAGWLVALGLLRRRRGPRPRARAPGR